MVGSFVSKEFEEKREELFWELSPLLKEGLSIHGPALFPDSVQQATLHKEVSISGVGLFTGTAARVTLSPAAPNSGILFQREDLPDCPLIPAHAAYVRESLRCTSLATETGSVHMVEHLLSALYASGVDNVIVRVHGAEIPVGDGSALPFMALIEEAGIRHQAIPRRLFRLKKAQFWSSGDTHIIALPAEEFRITSILHYPCSERFRSFYYAFTLTPEEYRKEIAPCRTFSFYEEVAPLLERGLIRGAGLENALVLKGDQVMNPEGMRFPDEMVRHKILDLIGDFALLPGFFLGHVIALRSGHAAHHAFVRMLLMKPHDWEPC